ncbi:MAG: ABC transporter ATP-binding protein [Candidatus Omnitrophica bacterium]|nr:ABC transporter ATP-binding protein [Candidatus Omnitrophota bacterium]
MEKIIQMADLSISRFTISGEWLNIIDNIDLDIFKNEIFCLVGESGSGKTTLALSILKLLPFSFETINGSILFEGKDIIKMNKDEIQKIRGKKISMIFQEPSAYLNPLMISGEQIKESLKENEKDKKSRVIDILKEVGLEENHYFSYPHQLSGGMQQRVMIAMAIINKPSLLLADEPTTALDVLTIHQIIHMLKELQKKYGMSILFITHDLSIGIEIADRIGIIYKGGIVEIFKPDRLENLSHPYSRKLFNSMIGRYKKGERIKTTDGKNT